MESKEAKQVAEGVAFTFFKKCPFLSDSELEHLKETVTRYLEQGPGADLEYQNWIESKNWTS